MREIKNKDLCNAMAAVLLPALGYIMMMYSQITFFITDSKKSIIMLMIIYIIYSLSVILFFRKSRSKISLILVETFTAIMIKEYFKLPSEYISQILNGNLNNTTTEMSRIVFPMSMSFIMLILNIIVLIYGLYKILEKVEKKQN